MGHVTTAEPGDVSGWHLRWAVRRVVHGSRGWDGGVSQCGAASVEQPVWSSQCGAASVGQPVWGSQCGAASVGQPVWGSVGQREAVWGRQCGAGGVGQPVWGSVGQREAVWGSVRQCGAGSVGQAVWGSVGQRGAVWDIQCGTAVSARLRSRGALLKISPGVRSQAFVLGCRGKWLG